MAPCLRAVPPLAGAVVALFLVSCGTKPASGGSLAVTVTWDDAVTARCFRVLVQAEDGRAPVRSGPIARPTDRSSLVVAVYQDDLTASVRVQARGFSDEGCALETNPLEASAEAESTFVAGRSVPVAVRVLAASAATDGGTDAGAGDAGSTDGGVTDGGADGGVDQDNDGSPAGVDCDDLDPQRFPGNPEVCSDRKDNDCDTHPDCADPDCDTMGCGQPAPASAVCQGGVCLERDCADGVSNDDDALVDCLDSDCDMRTCPNQGRCVTLVCNALSEVCDDGVNNNDGDTLVDCADPDCLPDAGCTDFDACTTGERCQPGRTCGNGTPLACGAPAMCFVSLGCDAGVCVDARADAGATCDDGLRCTTSDRCDGDGGCSGTPVTCPPSGACFVGVCVEADGGCGLAPDLGAVCSDDDACTENDTCGADGGCTGTPVTCPPPEECQLANGCDAVKGCAYTPRTGQACDGGTCNVLGQCQPVATGFPYVPSNFTEAELAATSAGPWTVTCDTTVNTASADGGVEIQRSCADALPPHVFVSQLDAGLEAVVLVASDFTLASGVTLRAEGARPLIIAARGAATVAGVISLEGAPGPLAAGAARRCGQGVGGDGSTGGRSGGGGGGAFGANASAGAAGGDGTAGGAGGSTVGNAVLKPLRGGCPGGSGGGSPVTPAGRPGGAVQVSAAGALTVTGTIAAGGGGGGGAPYSLRGGGGGGSGGAILLEGATITVTGTLAANGGGGGEASGAGLDLGQGQAGALGRRDATRAAGGSNGNGCGGSGGWGAALAGTSTVGGAPPGGFGCWRWGGGGGGGGSVGRIRLNALSSCTLTGTISPRQTGVGTGCP